MGKSGAVTDLLRTACVNWNETPNFNFFFFPSYWGMEKGMFTNSSILAWRIPWTEEPGRLQSMEYKELDTAEGLTL